MDSLPVWEGSAYSSPKEDCVLTGPPGGGEYVRDPNDIPGEKIKLTQD